MENGVWKRSEDIIESFPQGAVARRGPTKAIFSHQLNAPAVFELEASDGSHVSGGVRAILLTDSQTGESITLARVKENAVGEILPPNRIVYRDAFDGAVQADVILIWKHNYFCQDIVLRSKPDIPENLITENSRLEVVTEFIDAPNAQIRETVNGNIKNHSVIDFGRLALITGQAFVTGEGQAFSLGDWNPGRPGTPVVKEWYISQEGRKFLIESIAWAEAMVHLEKLQAATEVSDSDLQIASNRVLPKPNGQVERKPLSVASLNENASSGYVIDFVIIPDDASPTTFASTQTYYIPNSYYTGSFLTFQSDCVVKYKEDAYILTYGGFSFPSSGTPPVFTSRNDDIFGDRIIQTGIPGEVDSDGDPTKHRAAYSLWVYYVNFNTTIQNARFRWAKQAVRYDSNPGNGAQHTIQNTHFELSDYAVTPDGNTSFSWSSVTACGVTGGLTFGYTTATTDCGLDNATARSGIEAEPSIAVNPLNPSQIIVFTVYLNPHPNGLIRSRSTDGGNTWTVDLFATGVDYTQACCDPSAAFDAYGNLYLAYMNGNRDTAILLHSSDGGATFSQIYSHSGTMGIGAVDQPTVTTGPGQNGNNESVWITFAKKYQTPDVHKILVTGAPVTGLGQVGSFSTELDISTSQTSDAVFSDITVGPNGQVMVAYQNKPSSTQTLYYASDSDGVGTTDQFSSRGSIRSVNMAFSLAIPAQDKRGVEISTGVEYDQSSGPYSGRVYLLHTDRPSGSGYNTDIYVQHSGNNGTTWSSRVKVNSDSTTRSQFIPWMAVDPITGKVAVCWYDCRADSANKKPHFYAAVSSDGGATFSKNIQLTRSTSDIYRLYAVESSYGFDYGDYTSMVFWNGYLYAAWADNSNGTGDNPDGQVKLDINIAHFSF